MADPSPEARGRGVIALALLLAGLLALAGLLQPAAAQGTEGGPTTSTTTTGSSTTSEATTTTAPTTTTTTTTTTVPPEPVPVPDAMIRRLGGSQWAHDGARSATAVGWQTRTTDIGWRGTAVFEIRVQNDGDPGATLTVLGTGSNPNYTVRYRRNGVDVTPAVVAGTYALVDPRGNDAVLRVLVTARDRARPGTQRAVHVWARGEGVSADRVVGIARRPQISAQQRQITRQINATRGRYGRRGLVLHAQLARKAQAWAEHMARQGRLSHSRLTAGVPRGWRALAENVGRGRSLTVVHNAFLRSSGHRTNILGAYRYVGTGQAFRGGNHWVVHVFMRT